MINRVLLVQAYLGRKDYAIFPIGLCYVATPLSAMGKDVRIFDMNLYSDPYGELERELNEFQPDMVGYSLRNIDTQNKRDLFLYFKTAAPTLQLVRRVCHETTIVIGGAGFSIFPAPIMSRIPEIDFGVLLEAEEAIVDLVQNIDRPETVQGIYYRRNGDVLFTGKRAMPELASLPIPRRDYVDVKRYADEGPYAIGILSKRGCPLRCAYCNYPYLNGEKIRRTAADKVLDEIEYIINDFGVQEFMFVDGVFNAPKKHAMDVCNGILERGLAVRWKAWCDIKHLDEEFMDLMYRAGCREVAFSPDAATNEALEGMRKGIKVDDINRVFNIMRKYRDVRSSFGFFAMTPNQSFRGVINTIYLYFKFNLLLWPHGSSHIARVRIEPETHIYKVAIEEGLIDETTELLPDDEEGLKKVFYHCPKLWLPDQLIKLVQLGVESVVKPIYRQGRSLITGQAHGQYAR